MTVLSWFLWLSKLGIAFTSYKLTSCLITSPSDKHSSPSSQPRTLIVMYSYSSAYREPRIWVFSGTTGHRKEDELRSKAMLLLSASSLFMWVPRTELLSKWVLQSTKGISLSTSYSPYFCLVWVTFSLATLGSRSEIAKAKPRLTRSMPWVSSCSLVVMWKDEASRLANCIAHKMKNTTKISVVSIEKTPPIYVKNCCWPWKVSCTGYPNWSNLFSQEHRRRF